MSEKVKAVITDVHSLLDRHKLSAGEKGAAMMTIALTLCVHNHMPSCEIIRMFVEFFHGVQRDYRKSLN